MLIQKLTYSNKIRQYLLHWLTSFVKNRLASCSRYYVKLSNCDLIKRLVNSKANASTAVPPPRKPLIVFLTFKVVQLLCRNCSLAKVHNWRKKFWPKSLEKITATIFASQWKPISAKKGKGEIKRIDYRKATPLSSNSFFLYLLTWTTKTSGGTKREIEWSFYWKFRYLFEYLIRRDFLLERSRGFWEPNHLITIKRTKSLNLKRPSLIGSLQKFRKLALGNLATI